MMTILIAEHHFPSHRRLLRATLEAAGNRVLEADDGARALELLESEWVDAIVSDILLPKLDGFRLCQEIRRSPRWNEIPFIFYAASYSVYDSHPDAILAEKLGGDGFLCQPSPCQAIITTIERALQGGRRTAPLALLNREGTVFHEYSDRLVARLEAKNRELAELNRKYGESLSARNVAETALDASNLRFYDVLENVSLIAITLDGNGLVTFCNDFLLFLTGWNREEVFGQPWFDRFGSDPASASAQIELFCTTLKAGRLPLHHRGQVRTRTGELRTIAWNNTVLRDAERNIVGTASIGEDVTERERADEALRESADKLRALALRVEHVREQERTAIAREIHDELAQDLTRVKIDLLWMAKRLGSPVDEMLRPVLVQRIAEAAAQTDQAITHVQRIATELRPPILDSLGLPAAVEWQVEDFGRRTGLTCVASTAGPDLPLERERATAVFRILQECLVNVARHAEATAVEVRLTHDAGAVTLAVLDNGRGISSAEIASCRSIGLIGMSERAQAFGGRVDFSGRPGGGSVVTVHLPLNPPMAS